MKERGRCKIVVVLGSISRAGAGVAQSARLLARAVYGQVTEIEVMTLEDRFYRDDVRSWTPLTVRAFTVVGPARYGFSPGLLLALLRSDADIAHVHGVWMFHCLAVYLWALFKRKPYIVTPHGMLEAWIRKRSLFLKGTVSWLYQQRFLCGAALLHLLTETERIDVADVAGDRRVRVVPNCVDPFEPPGGVPGWWRAAFEGRDVYLFFGRIHEKKGCMELCAAWDRLCGVDFVFRDRSVLVFGGWIDGLPGFADGVAELNRRHRNVVFAGPQYGDDKCRSLAAASFFLLPSKSEGLPMSVLEAWSAGKPVLMTRACNLAIGFDAGAALEIGPDEDGIRCGLMSASAMDQERRSAMAEAGRALVAKRYSSQAVAAEMMALYRDALRQ
jgi:glycosyltransferase involved in cell wall biosynthesis